MKTMSILTSILALLGIGGCNHYKTVSADEFESITATSAVQLVDVRTPAEFKDGHIPGAVNIDVKEADFINKATAALDSQRPVAVYCRSGKRSAMAAGKLASKGYEVINLNGGILAWEGSGKAVVADTPYEVDEFSTTSGKTVRFHALVHASIWIEYDSLNIYVDPVRALGDRKIDWSMLPKADLVLVTHEHGDHFDKELLAQLTSAEGRNLITNARCAEMIGYGEVMANGDSKAVREDISLDAVPAYNYTEGHTQFHPKGRDNGYILSLDGLRIYIAGDTEDIPEMADIKDIDVAFLPCNQPFTMTQDQLVRAAKVVAPKVVFPYHYSSTDVSVIAAELPGIDVRIRQYQ